MRIFLLSFTLILSLHFSVYSQSANVTQGCVPFEVEFTAPSGMTNYFWDFDNGTTSTLSDPSATFTSEGVFNVNLYDQPGGSLIGTVIITGFNPPMIDIFATTDAGCAPLDITFSYNATLPQGVNILEHQWVFGDGGNVVTSDFTAFHTFQTGGIYYVSLELITDAPSCNRTIVIDDFMLVEDEPDSGILTNPEIPQSCTSPFDITFSPNWTDAASYSWDFGNGNTSSQQNPPVQTYTEGTFETTLTVTSNLGCTSTSSQIVSVGSPEAVINIPDTLCLNVPYEINNGNPPLFYLWDFGPNATPNLSGIASPIVTFNSSGFQTVSLTVIALDQSCATTITKDIFIEEADASFITEPSFSCANPLITTASAINQNAASYEWSFPSISNPTTANTPNVSVEISDTSAYFPYSEVPLNVFVTQLSIITTAGCRDTTNNFDTPDTIALFKANFFESDVRGCAPIDVTFEDASTNIQDIVQWNWFVNDVLVQSNNAPIDFQYTFSSGGDYEVYLVVETNIPECPGDTSAVHIIEVGEVYDLTGIEGQFTCQDQIICAGEDVVGSCSTIGLTLDGRSVNVDLVEIIDGNIVVEDNGCLSIKPLDSSALPCNITVLQGPVAIMDCSSDCATPFDVSLTSNSLFADQVLWDFGDGNTSNSPNVNHTYNSTGDYLVTLSAFNSSGCPPDTSRLMVHIRDIEANLTPIDISCTTNDSILITFNASNSQDVYETCSTGYNWDYLNDELPSFSTSSSIIEEWIEASTFDILRLITSDINGCKDTTSINVFLYSGTAEIGLSDSKICNNQEVAFTNLSLIDTSVVDILWEFGDGSTSNEANPVHTYSALPPNSSNYYVTLSVTDALGCTYAASDSIGWYNFTSEIITDSIACLGQPFSISATDFTDEGSFLNYSWNFGNGATATGQTNDVIYNALGNYEITLTYTEDGSGCVRTTSTMIEVVPFPTAAFISDNNNAAILCDPANVLFTNTSTSTTPLTYFWDFGNGQTSLLENPATVFNEGEYIVKLVVTNEQGCQDSISRAYTVLNPQGSFTIDQDVICKGDAITFTLVDTSEVGSFTWDFGDGVTVSDVNPVTHTYDFHPPSGTTVASLILSSEGGLCPFAVDTTIYIQDVIADFIRNNGIDTAICFGPYSFENISQNADEFMWDFGDGTSSTETNPVHNYPSPGTYDVTLSIENNTLGCVDTISYPAILYPIPVTEIEGDTICEEEILEIFIENYNPNSSYVWAPQNTIQSETDSSIIVSPSNTVTYTLSETTEFGCTDDGSADVLVVLENTYQDFDTTIVIGDQLVLPVEYQDYYIFNWNPEEGLSCLDCSFPVAGPVLEETTYDLNITDIYGCFESDIIFTILLHEETFINMPTTFTPNQDGANDNLPVFGWGIKELLGYQIFNRWGEKVFETTDITEGWDGTFKGVPQNPDVYAFKIKVLTWGDEELIQEGWINLVR